MLAIDDLGSQVNLSEIYQDQSLHGHFLLGLPEKIWSFSQGEFCLYERPDPGTLVVDRNYFIAKSVRYQKGNTFNFRTEFIFEKQLFDLIEFAGRRVLGSCITAVSFLTLSPLGFAAKLLNLSFRQIGTCITSSSLAEKVYQIWNNADLFGNSLTTAPSNFYQFSTAPLSWHLRADGTDRRAYIASYGPAGNAVHEAEYQLVPFELFEFIYRRALGGALTITTGILSPVGFVAKSLHLLSKAVFSSRT